VGGSDVTKCVFVSSMPEIHWTTESPLGAGSVDSDQYKPTFVHNTSLSGDEWRLGPGSLLHLNFTGPVTDTDLWWLTSPAENSDVKRGQTFEAEAADNYESIDNLCIPYQHLNS